MILASLQWTRATADDWYQVKLFLEHASGFSMDALHVIVGVLLQLGFAFLLRSSLARPLPLLAVLALELVNEASDFRVETWPQPGMQFGESAKDVIMTMAIPTALFLIARYRPKLLVHTPS